MPTATRRSSTAHRRHRTRRICLGLVAALVAASGAVSLIDQGTARAAVAELVPLYPVRLLETRTNGEPTIDGRSQGIGRQQRGSTVELRVAGRGGVPSNASAVLLNIAAVDPSTPGFLTVHACDKRRPLASNVNFTSVTESNAVLAGVSARGTVCIYTSAPTDIIADVNAYLPPAAGLRTPSPARILDTRRGEPTIDGRARGQGKPSAGSVVELPVAGRGGVPSDAGAVLLNVAAVDPAGPGFLTVYACGTEQPWTSSVNFRYFTQSNAVLTPLSATGSVCIFSSTPAHIVADVNAYLPASSGLGIPAPTRLLDTRIGWSERTVDGQMQALGQQFGGATIEVPVVGRGGVPSDASAVLLNVAAVDPATPGFLTVYACDMARPFASNVNFADTTESNAVLTSVSVDGTVCIYTSATAHLVADVSAAWSGSQRPIGPPATPPATTPPATTPPTTPVAPTPTAPPTTRPTPTPTAPPTTRPTPAPTAPPATTPPPTGSSGAPGTVVGSQSYTVPTTNVKVVSPTGNDTAAGTSAAPYKTIARAISQVPAGGTVVVRGGAYHESLTITKKVVIQAWPGEAVWLDGSSRVSGWVKDGTVWRYDGWTTEFDASPTYTRGASDGTTENWTFVNQSYPMAAHPDQIWVDGVAMRQVNSRAAVTSGTFFHDRPGNRLYLGSDPTGTEVRASDLVQAIRLRSASAGSVLRGIGVRRFAPSVPDMGAVTVEGRDTRLEHVAVVDSATTGISVTAANVTLRNVHVARSGMLGIHGNNADNVLLERVLSEHNNVERFNPSPVAGGAKITRTQVATVRDSEFRDNLGTGLWLDESVYNITIVGSAMRNNSHHGTSIEISAKAVFADNVVQGNQGDGIKVNNTSDVQLWNNTFVGNARTVNITQDDRRYGDGSPGRDPRYPNDPNMTWVTGPVLVHNNVFANPTSGAPCLFCATGRSHADSMRITENNNVYNRPSTSSPSVLILWSTGPTTDDRYRDLAEHRAATGQGANSVLVNGAAVVSTAGVATSQMPAASGAKALPSAIASLIGQASGAKRFGAW